MLFVHCLWLYTYMMNQTSSLFLGIVILNQMWKSVSSSAPARPDSLQLSAAVLLWLKALTCVFMLHQSRTDLLSLAVAAVYSSITASSRWSRPPAAPLHPVKKRGMIPYARNEPNYPSPPTAVGMILSLSSRCPECYLPWIPAPSQKPIRGNF